MPAGTKIAHKTGTGSRGYMDAGIIWKNDRPLCILTAYTDHVPAALPDGDVLVLTAIPLPPAALLGFGLMSVLGGMEFIRRRRRQIS